MADRPFAAAEGGTSDWMAARLSAIRDRYANSDPEMVADIVRVVMATMAGDLTTKEASLLGEVEELGRTIASAKAEIATLKVDDINGRHIPSATDELDAIVSHTAAATEAILETCETLDEVAGRLPPEDAARLSDATTRIYEACSFQDITGQRITKVVAALKAIEAKVQHIVSAFGHGDGLLIDGVPRDDEVELSEAEKLLNGPQLPAAAMDQSEIDRLMASFD